MLDNLQKVFLELQTAFSEISIGRKVAIAMVGVITMGAILGVAYFSGKPDYQVLFSGLEAKDASAITDALTGDNVPYRLEQNGATILVPAQHVHNQRLKLATAGLPTGGSVGYEIFDDSVFGMTDFVQKLNFQRALQGELERTINQFTEIKSSRVHIAKPERRLFSKDQNKASASVALRMASRRQLSKEQVMGIVHLISSSVEGLRPEGVTVVDVSGRVLYGGEESDEMARLSSTQMEHKTNLEKKMEQRITSMLESIVGFGKVVARVSAELNFRRVEKTEKTFDPNSQVARSEQRNEQKSTGETGPSGVVGVQSNVPGAEGARDSSGKPASNSSNQETINYEINEVISHVVEPIGAVRKLSIAVVVDGKYAVKDGDTTGVKEFSPRSATELNQLKSLVTTAAGVDLKRGDQIVIESAAFDTSQMDMDIEASKATEQSQLYTEIAKYAGIAGLVIALFIFLIRPLIGWITASSKDMEVLRSFPQTVEEMESQLGKQHEEDSAMDSKTRLKLLIGEDPALIADIMRDWLRARR